MNKLIMGTTNPAKIKQLDDCLSQIGINVVGVADKSLLPYVEEDGKTVSENARKKALAYSHALAQRVISMDNALYFDGLAENQQPGIHVRRINGIETNNDNELLNHFQKLTELLGGKPTGFWEFGICIADPDGKYWETTIKSPRQFRSQRCEKVVSGYPLESIQVDPESGKYIAEMSDEEEARFWQNAIGNQLIDFVQSINRTSNYNI